MFLWYLSTSFVIDPKILIQPPGGPREQRLGEVRPKKFELRKFICRIFGKSGKKFKMKSQNQKISYLVNLTENFQKMGVL